MRLLRASLVIVAVASIAACQGTAAPSTAAPTGGPSAAPSQSGSAERIPVKFGFGNQRSIQYHPYYVAQEAGFFDEEGLDVDMSVVNGGGALVQQLVAGNLDIGAAAAPPTVQGIIAGEDLVWPYTYFYENIYTLAAPTAGGATGLEDMRGKVVGISDSSGGEVPFLRGVFNSVDMTEGEDYEMLPIGEGGQVTYEAIRKGDAQSYSSSVFDVASLEAVGMPLTLILPDEFRYVSSIGNVVTRDTFEAKKDMVERFSRAIAKATVFSRANPEAAKAIAKKAEPELFEDPALAESIWSTTVRMMTPPKEVDPNVLGAHYIPGWETYLKLASQGTAEEGAASESLDINKMVDSSLLEAINDFDRAAVEAKAREYQP